MTTLSTPAAWPQTALSPTVRLCPPQLSLSRPLLWPPASLPVLLPHFPLRQRALRLQVSLEQLQPALLWQGQQVLLLLLPWYLLQPLAAQR